MEGNHFKRACDLFCFASCHTLTWHSKRTRCEIFQRHNNHKGHHCKSQVWEEKRFLCFVSGLSPLSPPWLNAALMGKQLLKWDMPLAYVLLGFQNDQTSAERQEPGSSQTCLILFLESNQRSRAWALQRGQLWNKMDKFTGSCWPKIYWPSWTI